MLQSAFLIEQRPAFIQHCISSMDLLYLRPDIMTEPLIDHWYAWSHLIPPATAARNISQRHLRIMDSYIGSPTVHASAVKNPKLSGGPFMDYPQDETRAIRRLRDDTVQQRHLLLSLSNALRDLDNLLAAEATGYSLEPLYERIPTVLRGYVELVYNLHHRPSMRFIEPLLYRSPFYDTSMQSVMLSTITNDERPFVLSTPRLERDDSVHLRMPFGHEALDSLYRMTHTPAPRAEVEALISLASGKEELFRTFFTDERPVPYRKYEGQAARWRYFGHACVLVETAGMSVLVDPVLSYTYDSNVPRYTYQDLPEVIDYVLITHNHQDHILFETLLQIRHRVGSVIVPRNGGGELQDPSLKLILQNCGFRNVYEIGEMEQIETFSGSILAIPFLGEHGDLNVLTKAGYVVHAGNRSILFAADSCNLDRDMYRHIHDVTGDIDVLFLGMECDGAPMSWVYGPLMLGDIPRGMDQSRRLAGSHYERAMKIVEDLKCREIYVYAMGLEPWLRYIMSIQYTAESNPIVQSNRFISDCRARQLNAERLFGEKEFLLS